MLHLPYFVIELDDAFVLLNELLIVLQLFIVQFSVLLLKLSELLLHLTDLVLKIAISIDLIKCFLLFHPNPLQGLLLLL